MVHGWLPGGDSSPPLSKHVSGSFIAFLQWRHAGCLSSKLHLHASSLVGGWSSDLEKLVSMFWGTGRE